MKRLRTAKHPHRLSSWPYDWFVKVQISPYRGFFSSLLGRIGTGTRTCETSTAKRLWNARLPQYSGNISHSGSFLLRSATIDWETMVSRALSSAHWRDVTSANHRGDGWATIPRSTKYETAVSGRCSTSHTPHSPPAKKNPCCRLFREPRNSLAHTPPATYCESQAPPGE